MILGVSSCLLGNMCRYDGHGAKDDFVFNSLKDYFTLLPYCPENSIWNSPREAIRQVSIDGEVKIFTSTKEPKDVTDILDDASEKMALKACNDDLCGFVLKSASPTCGMERVKVYQPLNAPSIKNGVGVFAKKLKQMLPNLPIEEEGRLNDAWLRENFLMQVYSYADLKELLKKEKKISNLVEFHTSYKYLIYSKSQNSYKILGKIVANSEKKDIEELYKDYEAEFLKAIATKSTLNKTYNILLHIFGYFKKHITKEEKISNLIEFHTSYKYLIYSKSQNSYKILGKIVANNENKDIEELYKDYEAEFLKAIATKSTLNKTYNILLHIFGYFKKHITKEEKVDILESMYDFKNRVIPLISVIKIFNIYINRFDIAYLKNQKFLNPYPSKLALRSDLKSFK